MTVEELIRVLKQLPPDAQVVQSVDPEGNGFWRTGNVAHDCLFDFADKGMLHQIGEDKQNDCGVLAVVLWAGYGRWSAAVRHVKRLAICLTSI